MPTLPSTAWETIPGNAVEVRPSSCVDIPPRRVRRARAQIPPVARTVFRVAGRSGIRASVFVGGVLVPPVARLGWRFVAGRPVVGTSRTDATFWRRGTLVPGHRGRTHTWSHLRGVERSAVRLAGMSALIATGELLAPVPTDLTVGGVAASMLGYGGHRIVSGVASHQHRRRLLKPLSAALAPLLSITPAEALNALQIPAGLARSTDGPVGRVLLPGHWQASADQRTAVGHLIESRLPIEVDLSWRMAAHPMHLMITASPRPPEFVSFADMADEITGCAVGEVILGVDRRGEIVRGNWNSDDPHWAASCGSGRGKSSWLQLIAAQILHQDPAATLTAIDPKMVSFEPLAGIPGVDIHNDPRAVPAMWEGIARFRAVMEDRVTQLATDPTAGERFPFALLMVDELNMFSAMTAALWRDTKEKGQPATAPVWTDLAAVAWMGRAARCHLVVVGQRLDSRATGGIGLRDSFGFRALSGYTPQQWAMLVGTTPIPRSQRGRGRWIYSDGQDHTWVQNVYGTPAEIRDYALAGRRRTVATHVALLPPKALYAAETAPVATCDIPAASTVEWVVGLNAGAAHTGMSVAAFRKRRERAGGTLPGEARLGNQPAWTTTDLHQWDR